MKNILIISTLALLSLLTGCASGPKDDYCQATNAKGQCKEWLIGQPFEERGMSKYDRLQRGYERQKAAKEEAERQAAWKDAE